MIINTDQRLEEKIDSYPDHIKPLMSRLRDLILEVADNDKGIQELEETLKWGEPSFLTKHGSTLRMDWKSKKPEQYALYFKCTSQLVPSIRKVYGDVFHFEKNRAIVFNLDDELPLDALKQCIRAALNYHKVKQEPLLGLSSQKI